MTVLKTGQHILQEIHTGFSQLPESGVDNLISQIRKARRVFCVGAGRSRIMLSAFCMRLNHLGIEAYVAGNIPCPPASAGDLVIAASGSGTTPSVVAILKRAKEAGAAVVMFTAAATPELRDTADTIIEIQAPNGLINKNSPESTQLMRTLFEQIVFIAEESIIAILSKGIPVEEIAKRHTNLE
ncbi:SIS domain-containing protein [Breznakiella homolactica]|uniref:SIS domain-containing protein n=1 Tax=Breznakiella homolactica TaxID=2798577 RepID=A0A7T7XN69_9SPIR|nr:SIS domain-containing protein [Breznakiella homolactica]QQO09444.1 SIS domain-containing protein [Breznakiella homolactica]